MARMLYDGFGHVNDRKGVNGKGDRAEGYCLKQRRSVFGVNSRINVRQSYIRLTLINVRQSYIRLTLK